MTRYLLWTACLTALTPVFGQTVINPGANLQSAVDNAAPGATLALNAGTYNLPGTLVITKALTIVSNTPGARPVLQLAGGAVVGVDIKASNVRLESLRIAGPMWGVYAGSPSTQYSNITVRNLAINAVNGANPGHGLYFGNVLNAVLDSNLIEAAPQTGIIVDIGSNGAAVINNTVNASVHGIGITKSDAAVVAGNTIANAGQFGIILVGSRYSRVERNTITTGVRQDGIVVTRDDASNTLSQSNYVGRNLVTSTGLSTNNPEGTGIWFNSQSNGSLAYANTTSGAPENGFTIFNTSNAWFWGNVTSNNGQGGVFIHGPVGLPYSVGPAPANNFVQGNFAQSLPTNAGINLNVATGTTVFNNMVRNAPAGIFLTQTSGNELFLNILRDNAQGVHAFSGATNSRYYLNRHLTAMPNYADAGSSVTFDAGPVFGGNFQAGGKVLTDAYPYNNEQLGRTPSVSVTLPAPGTIAGAGTRKTIEWRSTACTYVDIYYDSPGTGQQVIVADYPDVGVYQWTVPNVAAASNYTVRVDCNNSAGASLGVSGASGAFSIAAGGLELLSPQGNHRVEAGGSTLVTWARAAGATGNVTVQYESSPGAGFVPLASNLTGNHAFVTVPGDGSPNARFIVRIDGVADSSDGFVNVSDATPSVTGPAGTIGIGTLQLIQWQSHSNSYYVDLEYWDAPAGTYRTIVTNLPDFGRFYFLAPDKVITNSHVRVRFKNASLAAITTANSGNFNTATSGSPGGGGTTPVAPDATAVSPASGTGASQTFTVTYTDANGATDISAAYFMVNPTINGANSCFVEYNRASNSFRLMNDAGNTWSNPATSGSLSNSTCTLNVAGSNAAASGNALTVNYALTFTTGASAVNRNTYALAIDTASQNSGWKTLGTWTVPGMQQQPSPPQVVSLSPTTGAGTSGTFTAVFRHPGGAAKHYLGYMLFLPTPNVVSFNAQGTCLIEYNRISNGMRLINDVGTGWIGPIEGVPVSPATAPLSNNACTVNVAGASAVLAGTDMTVTVPVTFKPTGVTTVLGTFIQELDVDDQWTDFRQYGNWVVPGAGSKAGPYVVASSPASGAGASYTLTTTVGHSAGAANVGEVHMRFNTAIVGGAPCHAIYFAYNNTIALINDAGSALVGPVALGQPINSGRCNIAAGGTRSTAGNNVTISVPFTFNAASFGGAKNVYLNVFDLYGALTHWVQTGTWTVQ